MKPEPSTASGSAPRSISSATISGWFLRTAKCSGSWWFSLRLIRRFSAAGIRGDDSADLVGQVHRDRGEDVVPRAATDEEVRDGTVRGVVAAVPAGRPADDLELMVVAVSDDVAAGVGEPPHDVEVPPAAAQCIA